MVRVAFSVHRLSADGIEVLDSAAWCLTHNPLSDPVGSILKPEVSDLRDKDALRAGGNRQCCMFKPWCVCVFQTMADMFAIGKFFMWETTEKNADCFRELSEESFLHI